MRPESIVFSDPDNSLGVKDWLQQLGISTTSGSQYEETIDWLIQMLMDSEDQSSLPSVTEMDGVDDSMLEEFSETSRKYFFAESLTVVPETNLFDVQLDESENLSLYCVVMGQLGEVIRLSIFASFDEFIRATNTDLDDTESEEPITAVSLLFREESQIHPSDLNYIENGGIPIAGAFAYPTILGTTDGEPNECGREQMITLVKASRILVEYFSKRPFKLKTELDQSRSVEWSFGNETMTAIVTFRDVFG